MSCSVEMRGIDRRLDVEEEEERDEKNIHNERMKGLDDRL